MSEAPAPAQVESPQPKVESSGNSVTNRPEGGVGQTVAGVLEAKVDAAEASGTPDAEAQVFTDLANRGDNLEPGALEQELEGLKTGTAPEAPAEPTANQQATPDSAISEGFDIKSQQAPEATSTPLSTPEAPAIPTIPDSQTVPTAEQVQKDFKDWEGHAQYKEPSAEQRAQGAKVEPINESIPPAEAAKTPEATSETVDDKGEDGAEEAKTPEQEAAELRVSRDKLVAKIATEFPGLDLSSKEAQAFLDLASENKQNMSTLEAMTENFAGKQAKEAAEKMGVDVKDMAKDSINGMVASIEQQLAELKKAIAEGDTTKQAEATKKGWLLKILQTLGAVLIVAGAAVAGAGAGMGALAGAKK